MMLMVSVSLSIALLLDNSEFIAQDTESYLLALPDNGTYTGVQLPLQILTVAAIPKP